MTGRRLFVLLVVLAAIGVPAGVLQVVCAGRSCEEEAAPARVPFCPLPDALKQLVANGYREGRSPDVLGVSSETPISTETAGRRVAWPAAGTPADDDVPMVFAGAGVAPGTEVPDGATLDRIAPTVSQIIGLERLHPEVRSGTAIEGLALPDPEPPRLVLLIAWKGVGSRDLEEDSRAWPFLASLLDEGAGTLEGRAGSVPLDPAATLTTIGTGGLPSQHGITGSFVRDDEGRVVSAFGPAPPWTVIATLADDLEEASDGRALVGLVATDDRDRGIVGGAWYQDQEPVDVVIGDGAAVPLAVDVHLHSGYGVDEETDVLAVVMDGPVRSMDTRTDRIVSAAERATSDSVLVVVAGTGGYGHWRRSVADMRLVHAVERAVPGREEVVEATVAGGIFLDRDVLTEAAVTGQAAVDAILEVTDRNGREMMADAFQGFAVSFARFCR